MGKKNTYLALPLTCEWGHTWESEIAGVSWRGAIFKTGNCPECGKGGKRLPLNELDFNRLVSDEDLADLGEDATPALAAVLGIIFNGDGKSATVYTKQVAAIVVDNPNKVRGYLKRLVDKGFLERDTATEVKAGLHAERHIYSLGRKIRMVMLSEELTL